jgi:hypothetical protein
MYQQLMATGGALVLLNKYLLLVVHPLGKLFLNVQPLRRVGDTLIYVSRVYSSYSYIRIPTGALYTNINIQNCIFRFFDIFHHYSFVQMIPAVHI